MRVAIFYGSDTGNTHHVAELIEAELQRQDHDVVILDDVVDCVPADFIEEEADLVLLGIPTWDYGQPQADWEDVFPEMTDVDFSGKTFAIFGCGDQDGYSEYFLDAMGMVNQFLVDGGAQVIGHWSTDGYDFDESKALTPDGKHFVGLGIDDNQDHLTQERVEKWCAQLLTEI